MQVVEEGRCSFAPYCTHAILAGSPSTFQGTYYGAHVTPEDSVLAACDAALADGDVVTDPDRLPSYQRDRSTGTPAGQPHWGGFPANNRTSRCGDEGRA